MCGEQILRASVRLRYMPFKSQVKFIHPICFDRVPLDQRAHSVANLRYQLDFHAVAHVAAVDEAIELALSL